MNKWEPKYAKEKDDRCMIHCRWQDKRCIYRRKMQKQ